MGMPVAVKEITSVVVIAITLTQIPAFAQKPTASPVQQPTQIVPAALIVRHGNPNRLFLRSSVVLIIDEREGVTLHKRNADAPRPIASLTKLMTALVILDANLSLAEKIEITQADRDRLRGTKSRLHYGTVLTRLDMLHVALAASDNRAAAALARTYPGGRDEMIAAMNAKARELGMTNSRFADPSGLHSGNVSTANDLAKLIAAARDYWLLRVLTTSRKVIATNWEDNKLIGFRNTNRLVHRDSWDIELSKTGYTAAAGNCLLMRTTIANRPLVIILLNSWGKLSKFGDSNRIRKWLINTELRVQSLKVSSGSA